ncbi:hypothetical protein [Halosimplex sp. J119]
MDSDLTRRRLLASAGLAVSAGAASVAGATDAAPAEQPSSRALDRPEVRWNQTYGPRTYNTASSLVESEGALVGLGTVQSDRTSGGTDWLFSVDGTSGSGQWSHLRDGQRASQVSAVAAADDGVVVLTGGVQSEGIGIRKVTAGGEQSWQETYEPSADGENVNLVAFDLVAVEDGFVAAGYVLRQSASASPDAATAVAFKIDAEGTEQWRHRFFEDDITGLQSISADGDGYVASGILQAPPESEGEQPPAKTVFFRFDGSGSIDWQTELFETTDGETNQSSQIVDHAATEDGYLLVGATGMTRVVSPWVVATDDSGSVQTSRTLESDDSASRVGLSAVAGDGDTAYVTGALTDRTAQESSAWLAALGTDTQLEWSVAPSRKEADAFQDVVATSDGGIAVAGSTQTTSETANTPAEAWLVKLGGDPAPESATTAAPIDESASTETPTPTPTASPTPSPTPEPTETPTPTPTATETVVSTTAGDGDGGDEATADDGAGFGIGATLAALGGGALIHKRGAQSGADADEN